MGEPRYTKGPWEVVSGDNYMIEAESYPKAYPAKRHFKSDDTGGVLAYVGNREDDYGEANAHLIAAAPEMFEALKAILDVEATTDAFDFFGLADAKDNNGTPYQSAYLANILKMAHVAIEKAQGQQTEVSDG